MPFHAHYKLVRDNILERLINDGLNPNFVKLEGYPLIHALYKKMNEELEELKSAQSASSRTEELCDVYEVLKTLADAYGISMDRVIKVAEEKRNTHGGFKNGIYLRFYHTKSK